MTNQISQDRKRLYVFDDDTEAIRFSVVHTSLKEARKWLWSDPDVRDCCYGEYVRFEPYWLKDADVSDLDVGKSLDGIIGIERGVYDWIDDDCPRCGKVGILSISADWDVICCSECDESIYEEYKAALNTLCDAHAALTGGEK